MHGLWLPSELPQARAEPAVSATSSPPFELWKCPLCLRASFESSGNWSTSCQCLRQTCIHYRTPGSCHDCWLLLWDPLRRDALQYPPGLRPSPTKDWSSHSRRTETSGRGDRLWDPRAVIQNAIYVNGVPSELLHGECIVSSTLFGRLGKISQVVIGCAGHPHRPLGLPESPSGVFVWFSSREEAETAIKMINSKEPSFEGMSATFCTTPFCPAYLRSRPCVETQCYLVHNNLSPPCNSTYSLQSYTFWNASPSSPNYEIENRSCKANLTFNSTLDFDRASAKPALPGHDLMQYLQFFACERPRTVSPGPDAVKVETVDKGIPKLEPVNPQGAGAPLVSDGEPEYAAASAEVSTNAPEVTIGKTLAGPIITNGNHESPCEPLSNPVQVPTGTAKTDKTCRTTSKKKKAKTPKASNENRKAIPKKAAGECAPPANDVPAMPTEKAASPICSCDTNINLPPEITRSNEVVPDFDSQKVSVDPSQFDLLDTVETISAQNNLNVTMEDSSHVSNAGNPNGVTVGAVEASGIKNGLTYEDNDNFTILSNCLEYIRKVRCANSAISIREAAEAFLAEAGLQDKGCFIAMNLEPVPPMSWEDAIECAQKFVDIVKEPLEVATFHSNSSKLVEQPTDLLGTLLSRLRGDEEAEQEFVRKGKKSKKRTKARNRRKKSQLDDSASAPELHGASAHPICEICLQEQDRTASPAPSPELQVPAESMQVSAEDAKDRDEPIDIIQLLDQGSLYILQLLDSVRWMVSEGESLIKMPTSEKWSAATEAEAKKLVKDAITVQLESAGSAGSDELEALERKLEDARSRQAYFEAQLKSVVRRNKEWLPTVGHSLMVDSKVIETATRVAL